MISIKFDDFNENYDLFVKLCELTGEPLKLSKDGKSDLIIMNSEAYERRKKVLDLREKLLSYNEKQPVDIKSISLKKLDEYINEVLEQQDT